MKRIIIHWTAGTYQPNNLEYQHYHYLINKDGVVVEGKFPVSANEVCRTDLKGNALYAAHTGGGNTGSIGIGLCGMSGYKSDNPASTKYLLTKAQCERCFKLIAELSKKYNIPITAQTVMTHYEFGQAHKNTSSFGKIDIIYLPPYSHIKKNEVGDFIRTKAKWYYNKLMKS